MTEISATLVKDLREKTGAGMMDCKKALTETKGNVEEAVDWLRKKGLAAAAKKAGRVAADGLVGVKTEGSKGAVIELNAETDFVARNEIFQKLVAEVAALALAAGGDIEKLKNAKTASGRTVEEEITHSISVIGENMSLRRAAALSVGQGVVASYIHNASAPGIGKIGVLVAVESTGDKAKLEQLGKQVAMHVAAAKPLSLEAAGIPADVLERERNIAREQAKASGKPDNIIEKMVEGRVRKFYEESVLLEQVFVIDGKSKVKEAVEAAAKEIGAPVKISGFISYVLGEGIEKEQTDFAAEVKAAAGL